MDAQIKRQAALAVALALLLMTGSLQAQSQPLLQFNTYVEGEIREGRPERWQFVARQGAMISFQVRAVEDTLDPVISIATIEGQLLISNDDAAYGVTQDALIEGFMPPRTGTFVLTVSSFGSKNAGFYQLLMLPGYAQITAQEDFAATPIWQTLRENTGTPIMNVDTSQGALLIELQGANQSGIVTIGAEDALYQDYYATTTININALRGWEAGLALRYQDDDNYYLFRVNSNAQWRFEAVEDGQARILQDWWRHPAVSGRVSFALGVLLLGSTVELFFDGQPIASFDQLTVTEAGRIGFFAGTPDLPNARNAAQFDNFILTTPRQIDGKPIFPDQLVVANAENMVRELQRRQLAPLGGTLSVEDQSIRIQNTGAGISRLPFISGRYENFVFGANISWAQDKTGVGGCGIAIREDPNPETSRYEFAFIGNDGRYGLQHREPTEFLAGGIYGEDLRPGTGPYHLLILALDDRLYLYINGVYKGILQQPARAGAISAALVNFDPIRTVCSVQNAWVWQFGT